MRNVDLEPHSSVMLGRVRGAGIARRIEELEGPTDEPAEHGAGQGPALAARDVAGAEGDDEGEGEADAEVEQANDRDADDGRDERTGADAVDADRGDGE